jgi:hypothetical protein
MTEKSACKLKLLGVATALAILMAVAQASDLQSPLSDEEKQLADLINQYRQESGLPAVPVTNSLTKVARAHVMDLNTYHPDTKNYGSGDCNTHSWSNHGDWTAVCYAGSAQMYQMHNKPREITESYTGDGYEDAFWAFPEATPQGAIEQWKSSTDHSDTILQRGIFASSVWNAMGVAIDGNYALVWFGQEADPAGLVPTAAMVSTDYPDIVCANACLTLSAKKPEYAPSEPVEFVLRKVGPPGSASLEGMHYEIEKYVNGEWKPYFRMEADGHFKTPVIEAGGVAKGFEWDQRQKGEPDNRATRGQYRIKFYAPNAFDGFIEAEFAIA